METSHEKGLIAWFARNSVAANLLMIFILIAGLFTSLTINKQMFPKREINWIQIGVAYPGAAPQEVEEGITIKIEEALESLQGLERVITYSNRNFSQAYIQVEESYDPQDVLDEVKSAIDSINSFPDGMERPNVERIKYRQEVLYISLSGDLTQTQLKELGREIHDDIQTLPGINISDLFDGLNYEIGIEVSKDKLREYGLSFRDIAAAVRNFSRNMSAGQIRAENGYISLRVENQAYRGHEFKSIPLINRPDGTQVLLGDVATVNDGFQEGIQYSKFNGKNSVTLFVGAAKEQDITQIAEVVKPYLEKKNAELPAGVHLDTWVDFTYYLEGRLNMMLSNMILGGILVFLMLALFLRFKVAFWVMMGLPVAFLGTMFMLPFEFVDVTINVVSLFGFILVLGIVVDDAIVIGESAAAEIEEKGHSLDNVIRGAKKVAVPATFGVLTTVAAFLPMVMSSGPQAGNSQAIGFVVIFCLLFSLVESKLILPAHLARMKLKPTNEKGLMNRLRNTFDGNLKSFVENRYQPMLEKLLHYRYTVLMSFIAVLILTFMMIYGGVIRWIGNAKIPHDFPRVNIEMQQNSAEKATLDAVLQIEKILYAVDEDIKAEHGIGMIGDMQVDLRSRTNAQIMVKLVDPEIRPMDSFEVAELWRNAVPPIPGLKSLNIQANLFGNDRDSGDISFRLKGNNDDDLRAVAQELKQKLSTLKGVGDINDSMQSSTPEIQLELKPQAYSLGLTLADVASQMNFSFYGLEAQRILRNGEEIRVMIRYPESQRNSIGHVGNTLIQTPNGAEVLLSEVAKVHLKEGVNRIRREDGKRTLNVWASVDQALAEPFAVAKEIKDEFLPDLLKRYKSVESELTGRVQEDRDSLIEQVKNMVLALLLIFALLAIPLKSYTKPFIIMSVIPFGVVGSLWGHLILDMDLSFLSFQGIIAAIGVVVNDSLVMVDFITKARQQGMSVREAVVQSGCKRFRAIILTSLTTFIGLIPIIMETSLQAKIVIPMAVSLAFGVLFATFITLIWVPALYVIFTDIKRAFSRRKAKSHFSHADQPVNIP